MRALNYAGSVYVVNSREVSGPVRLLRPHVRVLPKKGLGFEVSHPFITAIYVYARECVSVLSAFLG